MHPGHEPILCHVPLTKFADELLRFPFKGGKEYLNTYHKVGARACGSIPTDRFKWFNKVPVF